MPILRDMKSKYVYISSSVSAPSPSSQDWNYAAIFWQKQEEDLKYPLFYCSNFFTIRFSLNKNFIIRLFNKFLQYASIWTKLFNIFHFHSHVQTRYLCSRLYFVTSSWRHGNVVWNSFRLFLFLNIRLFRVMIIDVWKNRWIESNSAFRWSCFLTTRDMINKTSIFLVEHFVVRR